MTADDLQATGAMAALLKDALKPNLIQTLEHTPQLYMVVRLPTLHMDATLSVLQRQH